MSATTKYEEPLAELDTVDGADQGSDSTHKAEDVAEFDVLGKYLKETHRYPAQAIHDGSPRWELRADDRVRSPLEVAVDRDLREKIQQVLELLPDRQRLILRMRYGIGFNTEHNLEEIGRILNLTRERVRQLEAESLRRLKAIGQHRGLDGFLEN
jgi:RNA polymerase sigma factor (sigma-70 family)